ncbi:MAG: S-layer homology domain-containing protein, partial [Clostridiaceae bacterium]|nr:S-layer homology domain-containing protein [Clostridiaceae bacterium]
VDINIYSADKKISSFDGNLTIEIPYTGSEPVAVWYLNDEGELEKLESTFANGLVTFVLDHLSLYVIGEDKAPAFINPFTDVNTGDWFYEDVKYAYENALMIGTGTTSFSPNLETTRGMIVTILHRLEGSPNVSGANIFADVAGGKWYSNAVKWAAENRIVAGYGNGKFGPEDSITREQMAVILMNYAKLKGYDVSAKTNLEKFTDSSEVSDWATNALAWANAKGLINGISSEILAPQGLATRAQVAAILHRFIERFK